MLDPRQVWEGEGRHLGFYKGKQPQNLLLFYLENLGAVQHANGSLTSSLYEPCQPFRVGFDGRGKLALHIKMLIEINKLPLFFASPYTHQLELDI